MTSPSSCVVLAVQPSHVAPGGHAWTATGWAVIAAWTAVLAALARAAYRRDTERFDIERHLTDKEFSAGLTARAVGRMRASPAAPRGISRRTSS